MKHIQIILGLILFASVSTFAQSPRIKLNQITKDTVKGSVLISSPSDSGMVYSRDFYIAYGADTVLILYGDTLAATSGIISSVLSDGVTITGDGTTGSELTVDTNTVIATKQDLDLYYLDSNPDGYTSNTGTVTSVGGTGTVNGISLSGSVTSSGDLTLGGTLSGVDLASQVTGTLPIANGGTGATTLTANKLLVGNGTSAVLTPNDLDFSNNTFTINNTGISSGANALVLNSYDNAANLITYRPETPYNIALQLFNNPSSGTGYGTGINFRAKSDVTNSRVQAQIYSSWTTNTDNIRTSKLGFVTTNNAVESEKMVILGNGDLGIGATSPSYKLDVNGDVRADTYYYDVGSSLVSSSDARLKTNIQSMNNVSDKLKSLNLIKYEWNDIMYKKLEGRTSQSKLGGTFEGMIAQQVESIFPEYVGIDKDGYKTLSYVSFIVPLLKGFQEQQAIIKTQEQKITDLKTTIQSLITRIENLENK